MNYKIKCKIADILKEDDRIYLITDNIPVSENKYYFDIASRIVESLNVLPFKEIGTAFRNIRKEELQLTQEDVSDLMHIERPQVSYIETGVNAKMDTLIEYANAIGYEIKVLIHKKY